MAAMRLRQRLRRFTPRWCLPMLVKPDQLDLAVVGRGRSREAVIQRMPGVRPEQIGTSTHG